MKVNATTLRSYKLVHTWVGILSGVLLFIGFYAGAFTMFKPEIGRWAEAPPAPQQIHHSPVDALSQAFLRALPAGVDGASLVLREGSLAEGHIVYRDAQGRSQRVTLDEGGRLQTGPAQTGAAGKFVDQVHRNAGLPLADALAEPIVGGVALLYGVALISGLIVLLPSLVKDLLVLRIGRNVKRFWLDAHNLIGITSLPFHLLIALTTAGFCLHDWVYDTQDSARRMLGTESHLAAARLKPARAEAPASLDRADWVAPSVLLASARRLSPSFTPTQLSYLRLQGRQAQIRMAGEDVSGHTRSPRHGYINFDPRSGQVARGGTSMLPHHQNAWEASLSGIFAVHFGSFGGAPMRLAYAVMAVLGALLFYTGNLLWIESRLRKPYGANSTALDAVVPAQPRHVRWVAALTVGLCLGAVIGLPLGVVAERWAASLGFVGAGIADQIFNASLGLSLMFALFAGVARAGPWLCLGGALSTWLIPACSLAAACFPSLAIAKPYAADQFWIDVLSGAGGLLWLLLAHQAWRRGRTGDRHSVWHRSSSEPRPALPPSLSLPA
ncbi:MAG: PepSY domain-containing protein [Paucibacter sp.]|nr:PepSY domain-containing protein [Roseateles sp.]